MGSKKTTETINQEYYGEFFNENTVEYLKRSAGSRWFKDLLIMALNTSDKSSIKTVADVGCGVGHKTLTLKQQLPNADVCGFDFSQQAVDAANRAYGEHGVYYACEDITKKEYSKRYDLIAAFDVLEHIDKWEEMVKKLIKINNRYLLLSFPTGRMRPYEVNIGHFRNFQRGQMERFLIKQGYRPVKTFYAGFPFFSPILRDLTQLFSKNYTETFSSRISPIGQVMHNIWYILFRYGSMKQKGDVFIGLFEKIPTEKIRKPQPKHVTRNKN